MLKSITLLSAALLGSHLAPVALAGTTATGIESIPPAPAEEPFVTGSLSFTYDTHFMLFGQDVWAAGHDWNDALFHPALELKFRLTDGLEWYVNTWWDINDNAVSGIGGDLQEVDVNTGLYYSVDKWAFQLGYGAWFYGSQTEHVLDARATFADGLINPFVALHARLDGAEPFDTGLIAQIGAAPGTELGPVSLSFPITVSFDTDNFQGGDAGFAYVSAGIAAGIPLTDHVSLNLAVIGYHTNDKVIPVNPEETFVTGSAGISISF